MARLRVGIVGLGRNGRSFVRGYAQSELLSLIHI